MIALFFSIDFPVNYRKKLLTNYGVTVLGNPWFAYSYDRPLKVFAALPNSKSLHKKISYIQIFLSLKQGCLLTFPK